MLDTSRILQKGPEYLRKQMERDREASGLSAAERLAATKPEYVRKQPLTPETFSNIGSSDQGEPAPSSPGNLSGENTTMVKRNSSKKRPDSLLLYRHKGELSRGSSDGSGKKLTKRTLLDSLKDKTREQEESASEARNGQRLTEEVNNCDREVLARKQRTAFRIHREDVARKPTTMVSSGQEDAARKPTKSIVARKPATSVGSDRLDLSSKSMMVARSERSSCRNRVSRSHSDISSRYSRNFTDVDAFFTYCGLDNDIIELLGRANFCWGSEATEEELIYTGKVRSVSVVTSDDGFSQGSSNHSEGLLEDELQDTKNRKGPSVIERNARIIKWLYSCRNAAESGKTLRDLD